LLHNAGRRRPAAALGLTFAVLVSASVRSEAQSGQALADAVRQGQIAVVQQLLEGGADANACGGDMLNPLQIAAERGNAAMITLLLDKGTRVDGACFGGRTALMAAVRPTAWTPRRSSSIGAPTSTRRTRLDGPRSWRRPAPGASRA
jgi:ankyrin repeat protein